MPKPRSTTPLKKKTFKKGSYNKSYMRKTYIPRYTPAPKVEYKSFSNAPSLVALLNQAQFKPGDVVNIVVQGTGPNNRIGAVVTFKSIDIRGVYNPGTITSGQTPNSRMRLVCVYDKQANGALAAATALFSGGTPSFASQFDHRSVSERFIIIFDHITDSSAGECDTADKMAPVHFHLRKRLNLQSIYQSNGGTVADIATGSIIIFMASDSYEELNNADVVISAQLQYTDL